MERATHPKSRFVGLEIVCTYAEMAERVRAARAKLQTVFPSQSQWVGVMDPATHHRADGQVVTYFGFLDPKASPPLGAVTFWIPEGSYAVFRYVGSLLTPEWTRFYPIAIESLEELNEAGMWLEKYDSADFAWDDPASEQNQLEVWLPV